MPDAGPLAETPRHLIVGRVLKPWGVHGWVKIVVETDFPERFTRPGKFLIGPEHKPVRLTAGRPISGGMLVKFAGFDTPEAAAALRDQDIYIPVEAAMPLPDGEFYVYQLIGMEVHTDAGERLGAVSEVIETGSNDVYVVERGADKPLLLPATREVILDINAETRRITVHLMEGLLL